MKWVFAFIFTYFEYFSMVLLGFALFRYQYKKNLFKLGHMILFLSIYTTTLDYFKVGMAIGLPSQMLLLVLFMIFYMKKKIWTSALMAVTAYLLYGLIQTLIVYVYHYYNMMTLNDLQPNSKIAYAVQSLSIFAAISISSIIKLMNEGFALNLDRNFKMSKIKITNKIFLILLFSLFLIYSLVMNSYMTNLTTFNFLELFAFVLISSFLMILLCYRRDKEEAGV